MNSNPLVSVLMTAFNREKYIAAAIESVIASSYKNWELIIVDDYSKDQTEEIARGYEKFDDRIIVYRNEKNIGDYPNRNKAASYAKGKYIKYLDADDLIYPHGLSIMVETMEKFPLAGMGISQEVIEDYQPYPFQMTSHETYFREFIKRGVLALGPTGTIIKRDVFFKEGGFTGTRYIGDTEMWHKIAMYHPIVKIVPGLVYWRRHEDQEIHKGIKSLFYLEKSYKQIIQVLKHPDNPLSAEESEMALSIANKRFGKKILLLSKSNQLLKALKIAKSCNYSIWKILKSIY